MATLKQRMASHGFESNDDYEYPIRLLLSHSTRHLRTLNIEGDSHRRKTAFASALAQALEYENVIYHDFTQVNDPGPITSLPAVVDDDEGGVEERPVEPLDRAVSEACAYSEAEKTILILDQMQAADFREHIRIYDFICSHDWHYPLGTTRANRKTFLLFLISEETLYHSLHNVSLRVWTDASTEQILYSPEDVGLDSDAAPMVEALNELFAHLGKVPTLTEFSRIVEDVQQHIRTEDYLRQSIYGWTEFIDRASLYAPATQPYLSAVMDQIEQYVGLDVIEVESP